MTITRKSKGGSVAVANDATDITPHNTNELDPNPFALYIGGFGDVEVITAKGNTKIFYNVPAGRILPIRVTHVKAANTTATNILGLTE